MTRIKVCGVMLPEDATVAASAGADAIGVVFAPNSPRRVDVQQALAIRSAVPALVNVVALFMDQPASAVREIADALQPAMLQFHGSEDAAYCQQFGRPYVKAIGMGGAAQDDCAAHPGAAAVLLDGHAPGAAGGSGETFDWSRISAWQQARPRHSPVVVAGGLRPGNVAGLVRSARPWGVDASSGLESAPGVKDHAKIHAFIEAVRRVDCANA